MIDGPNLENLTPTCDFRYYQRGRYAPEILQQRFVEHTEHGSFDVWMDCPDYSVQINPLQIEIGKHNARRLLKP